MARITLHKQLYNLAYWTCSNLFLALYFLTFASYSLQATIKDLPGFNGTLPFLLETGYVNVGESNDIELFYYFIESEKNPESDPLILWLTGGPGCSGFSSIVYENGPLKFDFNATGEDLPSLVLNPYSWTKVASIIYVDSPVGTGFSYASSSEGYLSSNIKCATDVYDFLKKWFLNHPQFLRNPLYVGGDSYAGFYVPIVALEIEKGNTAGYLPYMSLQGYLLGNPFTNMHEDENSRVQYAHRMTLIPDEYYKSAKSGCNGEYVNPDPNNSACIFYIQEITKFTIMLNPENILGQCIPGTNSNDLEWAKRSIVQKDWFADMSCLLVNVTCLANQLVNQWANDYRVQQALHIREGTKAEWSRCNRSVSLENNEVNVVNYHRKLSQRGYRALIYSGDHDLLVPYLATLSWIKSLNMTIDDFWRPWFVSEQVAGYTEKYNKKGYNVTFATVKGAGHIALEYKPKELFAMVNRWFSMTKL